MTTIKLTQAKTNKYMEGIETIDYFINPAQIQYFFKCPETRHRPDLKGTVVVFGQKSEAVLVEESPEKIAELILQAEHTQCKL